MTVTSLLAEVGLKLMTLAEDHGGRKQVHLCRIRLLKYSHLHQFVKLLRREPLSNQTFVTYSCVTRGMIVKGQPRTSRLSRCVWCKRLV